MALRADADEFERRALADRAAWPVGSTGDVPTSAEASTLVPPTLPETAEQRRHDLRTTLTAVRLRTQLLLHCARHQADPAWESVVDGLAAIDADISRLVRQLEPENGD